MKKRLQRGRPAAVALTVLVTLWLVYNLVAIAVARDQVFRERGTLTVGAELAVLIGFGLVAAFDVASLVWLWGELRGVRPPGKEETALLAFGALCLILLAGDKVMVDEIGRETLLGWEVTGEWIILYLFLAVQLLYNLAFLRGLVRGRRGVTGGTDGEPARGQG